MPEQGLLRLQQWMQGLVLGQGSLPERLSAHAAQWGFDEKSVVAAGGVASERRRLSVYTTGYRLRLLECLAADFPALRQFLGAALFEHFGDNFLQQHHSQSFTLSDLGELFATFLEASRPVDSAPYFALPAALARVERARHEVLRAPGLEETKQPEWLPDRFLFEPVQVQRSACCRALSTDFALKDFYEALLKEEAAALPALEESYLALGRVQYRLTLTALSAAEYQLLAVTTEPVPFYSLPLLTGCPAAELLPAIGRLHQQGLLALS
ncbi:MAG: DUF2063 domain-containing protein [Chitinophagaceae bacterium]|nr:MAG: DUF2063 domain-containing protein [Chitinophagaceae bacterium]